LVQVGLPMVKCTLELLSNYFSNVFYSNTLQLGVPLPFDSVSRIVTLCHVPYTDCREYSICN
jgi:hypothetical protein